MTSRHAHSLTFVGFLQDEHEEASRLLYFCTQCGTLLLKFASGRYAVLTPEWSKGMLDEFDTSDAVVKSEKAAEWVTTKSKKLKPKKKRLGKPMKEVQESHEKMSLEVLLKMLGTGLKQGEGR